MKYANVGVKHEPIIFVHLLYSSSDVALNVAFTYANVYYD